MAKKAVKVHDGISFKRTSTGINVIIGESGNVIALLRGYNNTQNMQKGLRSLMTNLNVSFDHNTKKFVVTDRTPKPKKK